MISLSDIRTTNPVLAALQITPQDKIISVKENTHADSNFILTHIIKQILYENNRLCLVSLHNSIDHYQVVGKKLGYDLLKKVQDKEISVIEPIVDIVNDLELEESYLQEDKANIVKNLYLKIKNHLDTLSNDSGQVYLIIDDLSHLADLGVEVSNILCFVNYCVNLINNEHFSVILNNHVGNETDEIVSNNLQYIADVHVEVSALKTGKSQDVTGQLTVERSSKKSHFQYKAFDRGIKTFHPGESIYHLYK